MLTDLRFAVRSLLKSPGFTAIALLTLALGIGVNTSMFTMLNSLLFHQPAYPEPDALIRVFRTWPGFQYGPHAPANFLDYQARTKSFGHLAVYSQVAYNLAEPGQPAESLRGFNVSGDFFALIGVQPALGRAISADEDRPGHNKVIVLSDTTWRQRFAADPSIINRQIRLDGELITVIGVMPAGFDDAWSGDRWEAGVRWLSATRPARTGAATG